MAETLIEDRLVDLSIKLEEVITSKTPEAWEAALAVVQLNAVNSIIYGVLFLVLSYVAYRMTKYFHKRAVEHIKDCPRDDGCDWAVLGVGGFIILLFLFLAFVKLFYVWTWAALTNPELVIAKQIMESL